ncbi:HEPN domain-containing protein [Nocardioides alkalitolerans]|uniref:HEPN domain-containing protein n=1 Tax=Nocardioides alkalitolerans TaxID=281714 RepID=UPI0012F76D34|nr:HEPN domain-containing protein [Nocardioides alkalitolerans]
MASKARKAFNTSCEDIDRLLEIHGSIAGDQPGRKHQVEVLHKAAVVLLTAIWEAYCEDIAAEGLEFLVQKAPDAASLPKDLRKQVAKELDEDHDQLAMWRLAGDGWRPVLENRLTDLQTERNRRLNTPKTGQIDDLFSRALGISGMSQTWSWEGMSADRASKKLDDFVSLRGSIAHRGAAASAVHKKDVTDYYELVKHLVGKTGGKVKSDLKKATGEDLWN